MPRRATSKGASTARARGARDPDRGRERPEGCCRPTPIRALSGAVQGRLIAAFKALADPTRLELLRLIAAQREPVCVCDIVDHFELSQPTISHHLKVLREADLVEMHRAGIWSFYRAAERGRELLEEAEAWSRQSG